MTVTLQPMTEADRIPVVDLFNFYIENTFAAYPDRKVAYDFFDRLWRPQEGYPALTTRAEGKGMVGFGLLRPYHPLSVFSRTAEISYFLKPEWTRKGLGRMLLTRLEAMGRERGITSILASISSLNRPSLEFHRQNGFEPCGRLKKVGEKKGRVFDVIYMQKMIP